MADEVVQGLNDIEVAKWTRQTVADGSWMQKHTLDPLSARDVYLASAIGDEIDNRVSADIELQDQIDTLAMSTDVIDLWGSWSDFTAGSGKYFPDGKKPLITDNDIVKVLDDEHTIEGHEEVPSGSQTYWQWHKNTGEWEYVGYLNPYYSKSEIDTLIINVSSEFDDKIESLSSEIYEDIDEVSGKLETLSGEVQTISGELDAEIDSLSSTVSSNYYLSGNVKEGNNLSAAHSNDADGAPVVTISTKDKVSFTEVSAAGFSGTYISGGNNTATIENLIDSAHSGRKAFDVVNSAKFSANNTAVGYLSAGFSLSSKSTDFLSITKENNNIIGLSSNPGITGIRFDGNTSPITITDSIANLYFTNFDFVQGQGGVVTASFDDYDFVKRTQQNLIIGDVSSLNVSSNSTALGSYASANQCSFSLNVSPINTFSSYATNNSITLGETNYASYNSYAIGTKNIASGRAADPDAGITEVNQVYTIGYNNVNKGSNSYIIGSNNTNVTPGIVILGDRARNVHIPGDLLAVGNGNGSDALRLNFSGCHFNFSNHILLDDKGLLNYAFEKIYSWSEVMGLGLPVASTAGTPTSTTCSSTDDLLASTILIYGGQPKDVYAFYVKKAYSTELTNYTHSFRIYTTYLSNYQLRFGIPDSYNVLLKNFSDNGWGFPPGGSKSDTNVVELLNFGTNESYCPSIPAIYNNIVNVLGQFDCEGHFVEATNNGNYNYFWIHSIYGGQYLDVTIDSVSHVFIMRKGGG